MIQRFRAFQQKCSVRHLLEALDQRGLALEILDESIVHALQRRHLHAVDDLERPAVHLDRVLIGAVQAVDLLVQQD